MSFTSGALLYGESVTIAHIHRDLQNWEATRNLVVSENRLQMRTANASVRLCREVISRLKLLTRLELDILLDGSPHEQRHALWLAICKRYAFIRDFAVEVIREKYQRLDFTLTDTDYTVFFNKKAEWHPEVERVSPVTRGKQRQMLYKMLRDAGLLSSEGMISPVILPSRLAEAIAQDDPTYLRVFPTLEG